MTTEILETLTNDYDELRRLAIDVETCDGMKGQRRMWFRELVSLQEVSARAEAAALHELHDVTELDSAEKNMLERSDIMEGLAASIATTRDQHVREAKMMLYCDLVHQRLIESHKTILPLVHEHANEAQREAMGLTYARYKEIGLNLTRTA